MKFFQTELPGVIIFEPSVYSDARGEFMESFRNDFFKEAIGYDINFCQENQSTSNKGVIRGLHYQAAPFAQSKLVTVISGKVLDVVVDVRRNSPFFGENIKVELSDSNKKQLFIPRGFAHGFKSLQDQTIFSYKVDSYYSKKHDRGIIYNDKDLNIDWEIKNNSEIQISKKDLELPFFANSNDFNYKDNLYE